MPRGRRAENVEGTVDTDVIETPEVEEAPEPVATNTDKKGKFTVSASFKTRTVDGDRISHKYRGDGATLVAAIADVKGADEDIADEYGKPFPKGISINVNITIKKGDYAMERSVAPQTARAILDAANVELATRLFGL